MDTFEIPSAKISLKIGPTYSKITGSLLLGYLVILCLSFWTEQIAFAKSIKSPIFYRIEKGGQTSYILGTLHSLVDLEELPSMIQVLADNADITLGEFSREMQMESLKLSEIQPLKTLRQILNEEDKNRFLTLLPQDFNTTVKEDILGVMTIERNILDFTPLEASSMLIGYFFADIDQSSSTGLDRAIRESNLSGYIGMDTAELRIACQSHPYELTKLWKMLEMSKKYGTKEFSQMITSEFNSIYEAYIKGEETKIAKIVQKEFDESWWNTCYEARNKHWVNNFIDGGIRAHWKHQLVFIAVGVGHLVGKNNVLKLLEERGYKVSRVVNFNGVPLGGDLKSFNPDFYRIIHKTQ